MNTTLPLRLQLFCTESTACNRNLQTANTAKPTLKLIAEIKTTA
jgi:hypothetical protein